MKTAGYLLGLAVTIVTFAPGCRQERGAEPGRVTPREQGAPSAPADAPEEKDAITIESVTPDSGLVGGTPTLFVVQVNYTLVSAGEGELMIGFNTRDSILSWAMDEQPVRVPKGQGTHTFEVTATPKDWGAEGNFEVYGTLSEYPHKGAWSPVATCTRALAFK
jgi:hypothetical protein